MGLNDDTIVDKTLLHDVNCKLLQDRDNLRNDKNVLDGRLTHVHLSLEKVENAFQPRKRQKVSKNACNTVLPFPTQLTAEMDNQIQSCGLGQDKLAIWNRELTRKVKKLETQEVTQVLKDLVAKVEINSLKDQLHTKRVELQWSFWLQNDAIDCLKELNKDIQDTDRFEAMEKQLMNDRVVELETQLAQKQAMEREKEAELSVSRGDQEHSMRLSRVVLTKEFDTFVAVEEAMSSKHLMQNTQETTSITEVKHANIEFQNQKLAEEVRQLREKLEGKELKIIQQCMKHKEKIKELHVMLQVAKTREAKTTAVLKAAEQMMGNYKQCKEELKIIYTKFSSAMDSVSEKTMRLEEIEQEMKDSRIIRDRNVQLEKQIAQLLQEKAEWSCALHREKMDDVSEDL